MILNLLFSIIIGIVIGLMIKSKDTYHGPNSSEVRNKIHKYNDKCYKFDVKFHPCKTLI